MSILTKIFSDSAEKASKKHQPLVDKIGAFESNLEGLTDEQLKAKTAQFKADLDKGSNLDDLLPEAFAVVREAARRTLGTPPLRRPTHGRHRTPPGQNRRDEDRRGQNPGGHPTRVPECPHRARRPRGHGQRLPGPSGTRSGWAPSTGCSD